MYKNTPVIVSTNIDYIDGDQSTYKGMDLTITSFGSDEKEKFRFETGHPSVDYINMYKKIWEYNNVVSIVGSSSMDHFTMDGNDYKYLILNHNWEQIVPSHINTLHEMIDHYKKFNK